MRSAIGLIAVGIYGFGAIGRLIARVAIERGYDIVGAVDIDPNIVGRDVGELAVGEKIGVEVSGDVADLYGSEIVFHSTGSYLDKVYHQLVDIANIGSNIISTCETLSFPYYRYPTLAKRLDEVATLREVTILGAGVNPGFLLDVLPAVLAAPVHMVRKVVATRSLDASKRREPFRKKIGLGLEPGEARDKFAKGELSGHVGYAESVLLIATALGLSLSRVEESQDVEVASEDIVKGEVRIGRGRVRGVRGYGAGYIANEEVIRVEFRAAVDAEEYEEVTIHGRDYSVSWRSSGTPGDLGTASVVVSLAESVLSARPGLLTLVDFLPFKGGAARGG